MTAALNCIQLDHHSFASVLTCLQAELREIGNTGRRPNFPLIGQVLAYVEDFLDTFHHPKEDEYIFRLLRLRAPDLTEMLNMLRNEHHKGKEMVAELKRQLQLWQRGQAGAAAFMASFAEYHNFEREHVRTEEKVILPRAADVLTDIDWAEINAAFLRDRDPLFDDHASQKFALLRSEIDRLSPPPYGRGEAA